MTTGEFAVVSKLVIADIRRRPGRLLLTILSTIAAACVAKSADCVVNEIFNSVAEHAAGVEAFDDQTVVAIKVKSGAGKRK